MQAPSRSDYTVCDLADEEVHFSRHSSDYYYCRQESPPPSTPNDEPANSEQIASNRLLSSLSSRLRRGSNYLNAPARLVGQYLLGITIQSWSEFFNTARMARAPCTRHQLSRRLATNLSHFQGNYLCVSLVLVVYCILTSPLLLIAIACYLVALYLVTARSALGRQTKLFGYRLNLQQQYSFITMLALPPLWIAGAPSAVFWVIGASFFVVGLHATMYANEQLADEHLTPTAIHTPAGYQLNGPPKGAFDYPTTSLRYYNHYPGGGVARTVAKENKLAYTQLPAPPAKIESTGSGVSNAIVQWIIFGANRSTAARVVASSGAGPTAHSMATGDHLYKQTPRNKEPEVKIISHDYAGLGRVYEV
jgi:hypothetical protein